MRNFEEMIDNSEEVSVSSTSHGRVSAPSLSIINSQKNGKRLVLSNGLLNALNNPSHIQIRTSKKDNVLFIGENLGAENTFNFSPSNPNIVYCGGVIRTIVADLNLDFSNKVSLTLKDIEIGEYKGGLAAYIKIKNKK